MKMADVGAKAVTERRARAGGRLRMGADAFAKLRDGGLKKGNPLPMAEVAAITGAKRTSEWIPLCHPLPLDHVAAKVVLEEATCSVWVEVEALAHAKTGVEMEALTGVTNALLALYDVIKADDRDLLISDIKLIEKTGGKSDVHAPSLPGVSALVITVSDRVSQGSAKDTSGPAIVEWLRAEGANASTKLVPDERPQIVAAICAASAKLVILTGGTGLAPRDITPEALAEACDRLVPGIGEAFRAKTSSRSDKAWLSRATAGIRGDTLVVALPGSEKAVREGLLAIGPLLAHALHVAAGGKH
jgi:cyclic pyranopterin phosphate synthase